MTRHRNLCSRHAPRLENLESRRLLAAEILSLDTIRESEDVVAAEFAIEVLRNDTGSFNPTGPVLTSLVDRLMIVTSEPIDGAIAEIYPPVVRGAGSDEVWDTEDDRLFETRIHHDDEESFFRIDIIDGPLDDGAYRVEIPAELVLGEEAIDEVQSPYAYDFSIDALEDGARSEGFANQTIETARSVPLVADATTAFRRAEFAVQGTVNNHRFNPDLTDEDYYRVELLAGESLLIQDLSNGTSLGDSFYYELLDASGNLLMQRSAGTDSLFDPVAESGVYFVKVARLPDLVGVVPSYRASPYRLIMTTFDGTFLVRPSSGRSFAPVEVHQSTRTSDFGGLVRRSGGISLGNFAPGTQVSVEAIAPEWVEQEWELSINESSIGLISGGSSLNTSFTVRSLGYYQLELSVTNYQLVDAFVQFAVSVTDTTPPILTNVAGSPLVTSNPLDFYGDLFTLRYSEHLSAIPTTLGNLREAGDDGQLGTDDDVTFALSQSDNYVESTGNHEVTLSNPGHLREGRYSLEVSSVGVTDFSGNEIADVATHQFDFEVAYPYAVTYEIETLPAQEPVENRIDLHEDGNGTGWWRSNAIQGRVEVEEESDVWVVRLEAGDTARVLFDVNEALTVGVSRLDEDLVEQFERRSLRESDSFLATVTGDYRFSLNRQNGDVEPDYYRFALDVARKTPRSFSLVEANSSLLHKLDRSTQYHQLGFFDEGTIVELSLDQPEWNDQELRLGVVRSNGAAFDVLESTDSFIRILMTRAGELRPSVSRANWDSEFANFLNGHYRIDATAVNDFNFGLALGQPILQDGFATDVPISNFQIQFTQSFLFEHERSGPELIVLTDAGDDGQFDTADDAEVPIKLFGFGHSFTIVQNELTQVTGLSVQIDNQRRILDTGNYRLTLHADALHTRVGNTLNDGLDFVTEFEINPVDPLTTYEPEESIADDSVERINPLGDGESLGPGTTLHRGMGTIASRNTPEDRTDRWSFNAEAGEFAIVWVAYRTSDQSWSRVALDHVDNNGDETDVFAVDDEIGGRVIFEIQEEGSHVVTVVPPVFFTGDDPLYEIYILTTQESSRISLFEPAFAAEHRDDQPVSFRNGDAVIHVGSSIRTSAFPGDRDTTMATLGTLAAGTRVESRVFVPSWTAGDPATIRVVQDSPRGRSIAAVNEPGDYSLRVGFPFLSDEVVVGPGENQDQKYFAVSFVKPPEPVTVLVEDIDGEADAKQLRVNRDPAIHDGLVTGTSLYSLVDGRLSLVASSEAASLAQHIDASDLATPDAADHYIATMSTTDDSLSRLDFRGRIESSLIIDESLTSSENFALPTHLFVDEGTDVVFEGDWEVATPVSFENKWWNRVRSGDHELLVYTGSVLHHLTQPADVDSDGRVDAMDALLVINQLRRGEPTPEESDAAFRFYDVNGDRRVSSLDALVVINEMSRISRLSNLETTNAESEWLSIETSTPVTVQTVLTTEPPSIKETRAKVGVKRWSRLSLASLTQIRLSKMQEQTELADRDSAPLDLAGIYRFNLKIRSDGV